MTKQPKTHEPLITSVPLTAEAREDMLNDMFADTLPRHGELFIPDDKFYINKRGPDQALHMVIMLCRWLGIKPGYIGLEFEGAGGHIADGQRYTIYLETNVLWDEFLLGATLARSLTKYLIEERKQIYLPGADQPALLATGSVVFGLGLVVINSLFPAYGMIDRIKGRFKKSAPGSGYDSIFKTNYHYLLLGFIRAHGISTTAYAHTVTPWAANKLGIKTPPKPTHAVREAEHNAKLANIKTAGVIWIAILAICVGSFTLFSRVRPQSSSARGAHEHAALLAQLAKECKDSLAYQRQYADLTDIQTVRSLNAVNLRCQSLDNQYQAAQQALEQ